MKSASKFRTGCLRYVEWNGFWKAHPNDSVMSDKEWDEKWESLTNWLSRHYLVEHRIGLDRHCWVNGDHPDPERTLVITIIVAEVLSFGFLKYIQKWLMSEARLWRAAVPVANTDETLILIYREAIRINEAAESDLATFIAKARHDLARLNAEGNLFYGLREKPHLPIPPDDSLVD